MMSVYPYSRQTYVRAYQHLGLLFALLRCGLLRRQLASVNLAPRSNLYCEQTNAGYVLERHVSSVQQEGREPKPGC